MKIKWQKVAPGVYQTDTGRWTTRKYPGGLVWWIWDNLNSSDGPHYHQATLRDVKLFVDKQIEATNAQH